RELGVLGRRADVRVADHGHGAAARALEQLLVEARAAGELERGARAVDREDHRQLRAVRVQQPQVVGRQPRVAPAEAAPVVAVEGLPSTGPSPSKSSVTVAWL